MAISLGLTDVKIALGDYEISKISLGDVLMYSAGNTVTYYIDTGVIQTEEIDSGESCLSPSTFTPSKPGYTFVGWREDEVASDSVLTSKIMDDTAIVLYAVFSRTVTLSYDGNGATTGSTFSDEKKAYYNNGNQISPTFVLKDNDFTKTDYTFTGWDLGAVGDTIILSDDTTTIAQWIPNTLDVTNDPTYFNMSKDKVSASVWYSLGSSEDSGTVNINYGDYKYVTILFKINAYNYDEWYAGDRKCKAVIGGVTVFDSTVSEEHRLVDSNFVYTYSGSDTSIPLYAYAENINHEDTWVGIDITVVEATLSL